MSDDSDMEEVTGVTMRALRGDPTAAKVKRHERAIEKLQSHFEDGGDGKRGIVIQIDRKLDTFITQHSAKKELFGKIPSWVPVVLLALTMAGWFVTATVRTQQQAAPSAQDIARELAKQSQNK